MEATVYTCSLCEQIFESARARDAHKRFEHRTTFKFKHCNGTVEILHKSDNGMFTCPADMCSQNYTRGDSLRRHYDTVHVNQVEGVADPHELAINEGLCITPDPSDTPEILKNANLCVVHHEELVLLICTECHLVLVYDEYVNIVHHVQKHQREKSRCHRIASDHNGDQLLETLQQFSFTSMDDTSMLPYTRNPQAALLSPVPGIVIRHGFSCKRCIYYCGEKRSMANHRLKKHVELSYDDVKSECQVQILSDRVIGLKYFGVQHHNLNLDGDEGSSEGTRAIIMKEFEDHFQSFRLELGPPIAELAPWLAQSRWHDLAAQFMPKGVPFLQVKAQMVIPPKHDKSPLSYVSRVVTIYMDNVQDLVLREVDYRLRRLVEKTNINDDVAVGFNPLNSKSSRIRYCDVMAEFILCLVRSCVEGDTSDIHIFQTNRTEVEVALQQFMVQLSELDESSLEDVDLAIIHNVMIHLWTPKIPTTLQAGRAADCLFMRFLILHSLIKVGFNQEAEEYAFRPVRHLTQPMAMLKYWARATVLMHLAQCFWHRTPCSVPNEEADLLLQYLSDIALPTPFTTISQSLRLANRITAGTPVWPRLIPLNAINTACLLDGETITLDSFREMVHAIIREAHSILNGDVLLGLRTGWVDDLLKENHAIYDDINNTKPGYNFMTDTRNQILQAHGLDLLKHLFVNPKIKGHFVLGQSDQNDVIWNEGTLHKWMISCSDLQEKMNLLIHFTAGLPPRGEEYNSFLIRNTATCERSFYWATAGVDNDSTTTLIEHYTIALFQTYHKGANTGAPMKPLVRFLPSSLRALFVIYLCLVRPAQSYIAQKLWGKEVARIYDDCWFVDMDKKQDAANLSRSIHNTFYKYCGVTFSLSEYRHLAAFFSEKMRDQRSLDLDDLVDVAGGHTTVTAGHHYAQSVKDLRAIDGHLLRGFRMLSDMWHVLLKLSEKSHRLANLCDSREVCKEAMPNTSTLVRPHHDIELEIGHVPSKIRVVYCPSYGDPTSSSIGDVNSLVHIGHETSTKAYIALHRLGHKSWRSPEQAIAVALAIENTVDYVAVLPTGIGKSLIFMAPSTLQEKTVVVVVPFKSLIAGHLAECRKAKIGHTVFTTGSPLGCEETPAIIFVAVEIAADSGTFGVFINHLQAIQRLHSIVFDEIHTLQSSFRQTMRNLISLMKVPCQIIGLTATLPPSQQIEIEMTLGTRLHWVRSCTVRPNIRYRIVEVFDIDEEIVRQLQDWKVSSLVDDRAIVYCLTRDEVEDMAKVLQARNLCCTFLYSGFSTADTVKTLKKWESKGCEIMVATGVIGCGYNYKSIRLVIHRGTFRSFQQFHQESGRAGRDGLLATSCVISNSNYRSQALRIDSNLKIPHKWIEEKGMCRRFALHEDVDGKPQMCYLIPDATPCDICSQAIDNQQTTMECEEASPEARSEAIRIVSPGNISSSRREQKRIDRLLTQASTPQAESSVVTATIHNTTMVPAGVKLTTSTNQTQSNLKQTSLLGTTTIVARARPTLINQKIEDAKNEIYIIRKFAGNDEKCLMCWNPLSKRIPHHGIFQCPHVQGRCVRCLGTHNRADCDNKFPPRAHNCFKCHFPHQPSGMRFHEGLYGDRCKDKSGERLRLFMWKAWRFDNMKSTLFRALPEIKGKSDKELCEWIVLTSPNAVGNNFIRIIAVVLRIKYPEIC